MRINTQLASEITDKLRSSITIIIGGGAVGIYLANLLSKKNKPVLLIEAGDASLDYFANDSFDSIGHPHNGIRIGRAKSLGGTTTLWGGQLVEFTNQDFEPVHDMPKWLISFETLKNLYTEVYKDLGFSVGESNDQMVLGSVSMPPRLVDPFEVFLTRWLPQPNFAKLFERELSSKQVPYLLNATVVGMDFEDNRCCTVQIADNSGVRTRLSCARVVFAAGTIETVRLMANIAIKSSSCPWSRNDNLGRYFQDHVSLRVGEIKTANSKTITRFCNILSKGKKYQPKIRLLKEAQAVNVCAFFSFDSSISEHLVMLKQFLRALMGQKRLDLNRDLPIRLLKLASHLLPLIFTYLRNSRVYVPGNSKVSLNIQSELFRSNHRSLYLDTNRSDKFGMHPIVLDWQIDGAEVDSVVDFIHKLETQFANFDFGQLVLEPELEKDGASRRNWFLSNISDTYHHAGGVIMGHNAESSCVNSDLRVHETCNVFVAGACTFPSSSYANTTFTALALTRRLADHLAMLA